MRDIIEANMPLIRYEARRLAPHIRSDLAQEAVVAILEAGPGHRPAYYRSRAVGRMRNTAAKERRESGLRSHRTTPAPWTGPVFASDPDILNLSSRFDNRGA